MSDYLKYLPLDDDLFRYVLDHTSRPDPVQRALIERTGELGDARRMQIAHPQAVFMTFLTRAMDARMAIEVGTFTGYSALAIARGLGPEGRLITCDVSEEWTMIAREAWERAGVADRIDLRIGPALETLAAMPPEPRFDLAFIDADKESYIDYYEALLPKLRPNGLLLIDNTLWEGKVTDPENADESTVAIRAFNDHLSADDRVESVLLPVADGVTLIRKRAGTSE